MRSGRTLCFRGSLPSGTASIPPAVDRRQLGEAVARVRGRSGPFWNRHPQLPSALPGTFIRALESSPRMSCSGMMAVSATERNASRIMSQWISCAVRVQIAQGKRSLGLDLLVGLGGRDVSRGEPALGRVVVVRAGVDDAMGHVAMRQVLVRCLIGPETELEDSHSRQAEFVAQGFDGGRDQAQVFGD